MSKIEKKEKFDNALFTLYNNFSNVVFRFSKEKKLVKANEKFRNLHLGQRCFILGTGPSLRNVNYSLLEDEIILGVNYLYKGEIINSIKPRYYFLYDEGFYDYCFNDLIEILETLPDTTLFVRTKANSKIKSNNLNDEKIYYQSCNLVQHSDYIRTDITKNVTAPFNVLIGCIQTAIFMGFKEIYLLGSDFNSFTTPNYEHFYDDLDEKQTRPSLLAEELKFYSIVAYHHYALEKYARNIGVDIYNLTTNSLLDAYRKIEFQDIINK